MGTASRVPSRGMPRPWWLGQWLLSTVWLPACEQGLSVPCLRCHQDGRALTGNTALVTSAVLIPAASLRGNTADPPPSRSPEEPHSYRIQPSQTLSRSCRCSAPSPLAPVSRRGPLCPPTSIAPITATPSQGPLPTAVFVPVSSVSPTSCCSPAVRAGPLPSLSPSPHHPYCCFLGFDSHWDG